MEKITLREYAKQKKLSYFTVMKMVRNGDVKSETVYENGKDVPYIVIDNDVEKEVKEVNEKIVEKDTKQMTLQEENALLKQEILKLKEALERCNKRTVLV